MYDLIIIGAGLSGLGTALACKTKDNSILILEKGNMPRHKVCGEYLSAEVLPLLEHWGIDVSHRPRVKRALLSAPNGSYTEVDLTLGGIGISRYDLDEKIHQAGKEMGVEVHPREPVRHVEQKGGLFMVETNKEQYTAKWVISCHGKTNPTHLQIQKESEEPKYMGVKQYYRLDFPDDLVALHSFRGGYGGAVLVENGWVDMAFMIQQDVFLEYKNIEKVMESVLYSNPWMKKLITEGEAMWEQPMAVSNFTLGKKMKTSQQVLMAGDALAMIPPASGNGMAMALLSGAMLGRNLKEGMEKGSAFEEVQSSYSKQWAAYFSRRLWWGKHIQRLMERPRRANAAMWLMKYSDWMLRRTIRLTHGSPERVKEIL
jgi:flavin-dependent dehydrogenase